MNERLAKRKTIVPRLLTKHDCFGEEFHKAFPSIVSTLFLQMAVAFANTPPPLKMQPLSIHTTFDFDLDLDFLNEVSDEFTVDSPEPPSRRVGFAEHTRIIPSTSPLDIIESSQLSDLWYDVFELDDFRTEVRELCRAMRSSCTQGPDSKVCSFARDYHTRGLEQRSCLERQRRKYLTMKCVVRGQHGLDEDKLAQLSLRCTTWAAELAIEEAARDFVHAYYQGDQETTVKRTSEELFDSRRVRPRLAFPAEA